MVPEQQSVRCELSVPFVAWILAGLFGVGVVYVAAHGLVAGHLVWPALLVITGLFAITLGIGVYRCRRAVRAVEFTRDEVRLEYRAGPQATSTHELTSVGLRHRGDTGSGYHETSIVLTWRHGTRSLPCRRHESDLAAAPATRPCDLVATGPGLEWLRNCRCPRA